MRVFFLIILAGLSLATAAQAALVTPQKSVTYSFDTTGFAGSVFSLGGFNYFCTTSCPDKMTGTELLAPDKTIQFDFGTTPGASDLGTGFFTSPFDFGIFDCSCGINGLAGFTIPSSLAQLFVTLVFVDDTFGIDTLIIFSSPSGGGPGPGVEVPSIPLPSAFILFLSALLGLRRIRNCGISRPLVTR